ncbi:MAG: hypothetical protein AB7H71_14310 [Alphaproteobacteria bacterium]
MIIGFSSAGGLQAAGYGIRTRRGLRHRPPHRASIARRAALFFPVFAGGLLHLQEICSKRARNPLIYRAFGSGEQQNLQQGTVTLRSAIAPIHAPVIYTAGLWRILRRWCDAAEVGASIAAWGRCRTGSLPSNRFGLTSPRAADICGVP